MNLPEEWKPYAVPAAIGGACGGLSGFIFGEISRPCAQIVVAVINAGKRVLHKNPEVIEPEQASRNWVILCTTGGSIAGGWLAISIAQKIYSSYTKPS